MANILIIDDDRMLCDMLCRQFLRMGHEAKFMLTIADGLEEVTSRDFDIVYLDVNLPDGSGLDALSNIREVPSSPEVIIMTAEGEPEGAELAITSGAWDYIEKPSSLKEMTLPLIRALQYRDEKQKKKPKKALRRDSILGSSPQLQDCLDLLAEAAGGRENVLITGETGTGKELFAKTIHANSDRSGKSFVVVDCTALPESLVESILFGHEKGAFTGAEKAQSGLIKQADGGTLFLDEVGELPPTLQKPFLRVLQERRFRPLGSSTEVKSDFRLLAATNRDLDQMASSGQFRQDLLFRIKSLVLHLPPLRKRPGDIREIIINYLHKLSEETGTEMKGFSPEFFETLERYEWPGNVRELLSTMDRVAVASREEPILFPIHLPTHIRVHLARASIKIGQAKPDPDKSHDIPEQLPLLKDYRETAIAASENRYLEELMAFTNRDIKEACRISGLSRSRLYTLLNKYKITES